MNNSFKTDLDKIKKHDLKSVKIREIVKKEKILRQELLGLTILSNRAQYLVDCLSYIGLIKTKVKFKKEVYLGNHINTLARLKKLNRAIGDYDDMLTFLKDWDGKVDINSIFDKFIAEHDLIKEINRNTKFLILYSSAMKKMMLFYINNEGLKSHINHGKTSFINSYDYTYVPIAETGENHRQFFRSFKAINSDVSNQDAYELINIITILFILLSALLIPTLSMITTFLLALYNVIAINSLNITHDDEEMPF